MINQFVELGNFFLDREGVSDELARYSQDPSAKFRANIVLVLVFSLHGFEDVQVEEYEDSRRLWYLYREGPPNGYDKTSTTGMPKWDVEEPKTFQTNVTKRLKRLSASAGEALEKGVNLPDWEKDALNKLVNMQEHLAKILQVLQVKHPDPKLGAILTLAWCTPSKELRRVGDFEAYKQNLLRAGTESASTKKTTGEVKGHGTCSICGQTDVEVFGLLQVSNFEFYTIDKPGSVSGGFDGKFAWRNFPACKDCSKAADFSGERVKKELSFKYYGFKYLVLPSPVSPVPTQAFEFLKRLVNARVEARAQKHLTDAEDELFYVISEEKNLLQLDLLFYKPDPKFFRPVLHVSGLLPSRFRQLFDAKDKVDQHPWLMPPSDAAFVGRSFSFTALRNVCAEYDEDFLTATRVALELRCFPLARLLVLGMNRVREDFVEGKRWMVSLADLYLSILFFEKLTISNAERTDVNMMTDYGNSDQANRVRGVFDQAIGRLHEDAAAQAAFLTGACCRRIEHIQQNLRGSTPFVGKYKGLHLSQQDIQRLFIEAKAKAQQYGKGEERKVASLLSCAANALVSAPEQWGLSPDEVSYYFALGHALSNRLAKGEEGADNHE